MGNEGMVGFQWEANVSVNDAKKKKDSGNYIGLKWKGAETEWGEGE